MKNQMLSKLFVGVIVCAIAILSVLPVSTAGAQAIGKEGDGLLLEQALDRIELALEGQKTRLELANLTISQVQEWVARLQERGKDTAPLQSALATFEGQVQAAEAAHNNAQGIIDAKAGFDANGKVVDAEQARQTLKDARDAMKQCGDIVNPAAQALREAIKAFRDSLRPQDNGTGELNLDFNITG